MIESLQSEAEKIQDTGTAATGGIARVTELMARFVRVRVPDMTVPSYTEIPDDQRIQVQSSIGARQPSRARSTNQRLVEEAQDTAPVWKTPDLYGQTVCCA